MGGQYTSDGWTRLTNSGRTQATNLLSPTAFPSSTGFQVEFDYRMAGGDVSGSSTGDGMSMYLVNGAATITAGGSGSGLAYAGNVDGCGVNRGYLGVGLDVFGSFSAPNSFASGGPGARPSAVSIRGSGTNPCTSGQTSNFPWVTGAAVTGLWTGTAGNTQDPATVATSTYRRVKVVVRPAGTSVQVTVSITPAAVKTAPPGAYTQILSTNLDSVAGQVALPATLKLGFGAGVGWATNYQDIRNIQVSSTVDMSVTQSLSPSTPGHAGYPAGTFLPGDAIGFDATARNLGPSAIGDPPTGVSRYYQDLGNLPITGVTWTCTPSGGATCATGGGSGSIVSEDWYGPSGSSVAIQVTGTVQGARGNYQSVSLLPTNFTNNTVGANGSTAQLNGGSIDINTSNNTANVAFTAAAPLINTTKTVSATTIGVGQPVTYTATVRNDGTSPGTATFADAVPATVPLSSVDCAGTGGATCTSGFTGQNATGTVNLPVGGAVTFTLTGTATTPGSAQNTAVVSVTTPGCTAACGGGSASSLPATVQPVSLELVKTASNAGAVVAATTAGEPVTYSFTVTNTGGFPVDAISIVEESFTGSQPMPPITCPVSTLAPLASTVCETTTPYLLTQADVDTGFVTNVAHATGTIPAVAAPIVSNDSSVTISPQAEPGLSLVKASTSGPVTAAGDVIDYTFTVTNTGNVTLSGVSVAETAFSGTGTLSAIDCGAGAASLAPLVTVVCTASYTVTQADLNAGSITNSAKASATAPDLSAVESAVANYNVVPVISQELTLVKTANPASATAAGQQVDYSFAVTNSGNVTMTDVAIDETAFSGAGAAPTVTCPVEASLLLPGAAVTCAASYTLTQADVDAGAVTNTAVASGTPPAGGVVDSAAVAATVTIARNSVVDLAITAVPDRVYLAGEGVGFTFDVTNNGNVTLNNAAVALDAFTGSGSAPAISCPAAAPLAPGASVQCTLTAPYVVTQADMDSTGFALTATASATDPAATVIQSDQEVASVATGQEPALILDKTVTPSVAGPYVAGQAVTYGFEVTNSGNVTLTGVGAVEQSFTGSGTVSAPTCPAEAASMAPGAEVTCTATYTLTQADVDQGSITNTAIARGIAPDATAVDSASDTTTLTIASAGSLSVTNTVLPTSVSGVGATVNYAIVVTNTGNVTTADVAINTSLFTGSGTAPMGTCPAEASSLAPGASVTCSASYVTTQADINAGYFDFTVTGSGTPPVGDPVQSAAATATVNVTQSPALTLAITTAPPAPTGAGQDVDYSFLVTNTGNVTMTDIAVEETASSGSGTAPTITCPAEASLLLPGAAVTCTATYTLTQADADAGVVTNTAIASGAPPVGAVVDSAAADATVTIARNAVVDLAVTAVPAQVHAAGEDVGFVFEVTNNGNVTLNNVAVALDAFTGSGSAPAISCPAAAPLAPGASVQCTLTAPYVVTQADMDSTGFALTATASATDPAATVIQSDQEVASVATGQEPALTLDKTVTPSVAGPYAVGQAVTYSFTVTNSGNVTLTGVAAVEQSFTGSGTVSAPTCPAEAASMAPGAEVTCTATYTLTQADVDQGSITNTAIASGVAPDATAVDSASDTTTLTINSAAALSATNTVLPTSVSGVGATVNYAIAVTNTGNVTTTGIAVNTSLFTGSGTAPVVTCPVEAASLAPGASVTCSASYVTTQADLNAGHFDFTVTGSGTPPVGDPVQSGAATATVTATQSPALTLAITAAPPAPTGAGQDVDYSFLVTNTGNVTMTDIEVAQTDFSGTGTAPTITCPAEASSLLPGAAVTCTASYTLTQADADATVIDITATASGLAPSAATQTDSAPASLSVTLDVQDALTLTGSADPTSFSAPGAVIAYTLTITNSGTVTIAGSQIVIDAMTGSGSAPVLSCPPEAASIAPGESVACTTSYTSTQADIDAGGVTLTTTASGTGIGGAQVDSAQVAVTVSATATPSLSLTKTMTPAGTGVHSAGETLSFTYTATNTGNTTLSDVAVTERSFTGSGPSPVPTCTTAAPVTLAPGAQLDCTASYVLTQADVDAAGLTSVSFAQGAPPAGGEVSSADQSNSLTITASSALTLGAVVLPSTVTLAGTTVNYSFTVSNAGNVTLSQVAVAIDAFDGTGSAPTTSCPVGAASLAPGGSVTCTASYVITQADMDKGSVNLMTTASGTAPAGGIVQSSSAATPVTVLSTPAITVSAAYSPVGLPQYIAGQALQFTFLATNAGNVTLAPTSVSVAAFTGTGALSAISCPAESASLAPGGAVTCTADYVLTQADVDAGELSLTAGAQGTPPGAQPPVDSSPDQVTLTIDRVTELGLTMVVSPTTVTAAGQSVTYSMTAANTGTVTLGTITIVGQSFTGSGTPTDFDCPAGAAALAPGASVTCTSTYVVEQADIDSGGFDRSVSATGVAAGLGNVQSATKSASVTAPASSSLTLVKSGDPSDEASFVLGREITFSYVARNTGNVTLSNIAISEQEFTGAGTTSPIVCPPEAAALAPGKTVRCTNTYTLAQADIDADSIYNIAVANGTAPSGGTVTSNSSSVQLPAPALPVLTLEKSGTLLTPEAFVAGATINYTFDVRNEGNVTLFGAQIIEKDFTGTGTLSAVDCPPEAAALVPGEGVVCTAAYTLLQADVDRGTLSNSAIASATTPRLPDPVDSVLATFALPVDQSPSLALSQSANTSTVTRAGDVVTFTFTVQNTGNVTLDGVALQGAPAPAANAAGQAVTCVFDVTRLGPGEATSCSVNYPVLQSDIDAGGINNRLVASGLDPNGVAISSEGTSYRLTAEPLRAIQLAQTATVSSVRQVGDVIGYVSMVQNTGTVTIENLAIVSQAFSGTGTPPAFTCPTTTLEPGESVTCASAYSLTAQDVAAATPITMTVIAQAGALPDDTAVESQVQQVSVDVVPIIVPPTDANGSPPTDSNGSLANSGIQGLGGQLAVLLILSGIIVMVFRSRRGTRRC